MSILAIHVVVSFGIAPRAETALAPARVELEGAADAAASEQFYKNHYPRAWTASEFIELWALQPDAARVELGLRGLALGLVFVALIPLARGRGCRWTPWLALAVPLLARGLAPVLPLFFPLPVVLVVVIMVHEMLVRRARRPVLARPARRQGVAAAVCLVGLAAGWWVAVGTWPLRLLRPSPVVSSGQVLDQSVRTVDGRVVQLASSAVDVTLLMTWTAGCPYCPLQLEALESIAARFGTERVRVIALNVVDEANARGKSHVRPRSATLVAFDGDRPVRVQRRGYPYTYVLDRNARVWLVQEGGSRSPDATLVATVERLLRAATAERAAGGE